MNNRTEKIRKFLVFGMRSYRFKMGGKSLIIGQGDQIKEVMQIMDLFACG